MRFPGGKEVNVNIRDVARAPDKFSTPLPHHIIINEEEEDPLSSPEALEEDEPFPEVLDDLIGGEEATYTASEV